MRSNYDIPGPPKVPKIMAQYSTTESTGGMGSIHYFGHFGGPGGYWKDHPDMTALSLTLMAAHVTRTLSSEDLRKGEKEILRADGPVPKAFTASGF